ncbi:autotransporter outer membrane beta-barrel domain-containing protein [Legionella sp. D16C41]|uniref:autotransporter outer membrane beta-barrel domain-containing protein n=1 Tax=Legionella sp. D16C41 TaxID=3402688 RepID=UPI003AF5627C
MLFKKSIRDVSTITSLLLSFSTVTYAASEVSMLSDEFMLQQHTFLPHLSSLNLIDHADTKPNNFQANFFTAVTWDTLPVNSNWFDSSNWSTNTVPTPADDVSITNSTIYPVISGGGIITINSLFINGNSLPSTPSLTVENNSVLNVANSIFIGLLGAGSLNITGAGSKLTVNQALNVGEYGNGTLTILNGGIVQGYRGLIADQVGSTGAVTVSGSGAQWNNSSFIRVGNRGTGTLTIQDDGGRVTASDAIIGNNVNSVGTVNVSGTDTLGLPSTFYITTYIAVGSFGNGSLNINSGLVSSVDGIIAANVGGVGVVNVSEGGTWNTSGNLTVGNLGIGTLNINSGGYIINNSTMNNSGITFVGLNPGSTGILNLNGIANIPGTLITNQLVGGFGTKQINFNGGILQASANQPNFIFGFNPGELNLEGAGLIIDSNGFNIGTNNVLSGTGGLTKIGTGLFTLRGFNTYTGPTNVMQGGLVLDGGSIPGYFQVDSGAYLGGTGTVGTANIYGIIAPGNSAVGNIIVAGDYTQQPFSTYALEIAGNQSDLISVAGTATLLPNSSVALLPTATYTINNYVILHANAGLEGIYSNLILPTFLPFLNFNLNYTPQDVILSVTRSLVPFSYYALTANELNLATALESLTPGDGLYNAFLNLADPAKIRSVLSDLTGEIYPSTLAALVEESRYIRDAILNRLDNSESLPQVTTATGTTFWAHGFGAWGELEGDGNAAELKRSTQGFFVGADQSFGMASRLGLVGGFSESHHEVSSRRSNTNKVSNGHIGIYGSSFYNQFVLTGGAAYSFSEADAQRLIRFSNFFDQPNGHYNAHTAQVFGELGYNWLVNRFLVKPLVNLAYVNVHANDFTEVGGDASLRAHSATQDVFFSTLGIREKSPLAITGAYSFNQHLFLGWQHAYNHLTPYTVFNFLPSSSPFSIAGTPIARDALLIDAGLEAMRLTNNVSLTVSYFGQYSSRVKDNGVAARLMWRFC